MSAFFVATVQRRTRILADALAVLQETHQPRYARWEPVYSDVCQWTTRDITTAQEEMQKLLDFIERHHWPHDVNLSDMYHVRDSLLIAYERGDDAAIAVRAYEPLSSLVTEVALRSLKNARLRLKTFIEHVQSVVTAINALFPPAVVVVEQATPALLPERAGATENGEEAQS